MAVKGKKQKRRMGRRSKLTPELVERAGQYIRAGNYEQDAATLCGVSHSTWWSWKAQAEDLRAALEELEEGAEMELTEHQALLLDFLEAITRADAGIKTDALLAWRRFFPREEEVRQVRERVDAEGNVVDRTVTISTELVGDYRAVRDFMERRFRDQWSPRAEVTGPDGGPIETEQDLIIEVVDRARPQDTEDGEDG